MHESVMEYAASKLTAEMVTGKSVLEVGSYDVNGSVKPHIMSLMPTDFTGMDIRHGPNVDIVCNITNYDSKRKYDLVVCCEAFEHIVDWRGAVSVIKQITVTNGIILITTRSNGYPRHEYPGDFWRYSQDDMRCLFSDCEILDLTDDPQVPGVFVMVKKPEDFRENDLSGYDVEGVI